MVLQHENDCGEGLTGLKSLNPLSVLLVAIVLSSLIAGVQAQSQTITIDNAVQLFKSYLTTLGNSNLALHEVEEYKNNFYATYYEKNTGIFAFQMLIWKPGSPWTGGMMGNGMMSGIVMPEQGPNMMWHTKYGVMGGMMGVYRQTPTSNMTVTPEQAKAIAQQYLDSSFSGTSAGDVDTFYGYYNVDVLQNGKTFGMLSVNGYNGQVWYHSWHGTYIQTVTISEPTPVPEFPYTLVTLMIGLALASIIVKASPRKRT
jgi:hypothetical protein